MDDFSGANIDNIAMLLEKCGRYLMRTGETKEKMVSLVRWLFRPTPAHFAELISIGGADAQEAKRSASRSATNTGVGKCILSSNAFFNEQFRRIIDDDYSVILQTVDHGKSKNVQ